LTKSLTNIDTAWNAFLETLAGGTPLEGAMGQHKITTRLINEITLNPQEAGRFFEAQQMARRRQWSILDIDEVSRRVAMGMSCKNAVLAVKGEDLRAELYELLSLDEALAERFSTAEKSAARILEEELLQIADDREGDVLDTPKGPIPSSANVQRSRLMFDVRARQQVVKDRGRYAERVAPAVEVNVSIDHARVLEDARARARDQKPTPKRPSHDIVDAVWTEKAAELQPPAANFSTAWMDAEGPTDVVAKPAAAEKEEPAVGNGPGDDTSWREES
jgi:hypothetical protein